MKLGPRSCEVCGPGQIQGCWRCGATMGHRHLVVISRAGATLGRVAACDVHSPPDAVLVATPYGGLAGPSPAATSLAKRTRDRAYRLATSIVRERHYDEFAAEYAKALDAENRGSVEAA